MVEIGTRLGELAGIALKALPQMQDERSRLFSQKAVVEDRRLVNRGLNPYYSAASMVGILQQEIVSPDDVVPIGSSLDALHAAAAESHSAPLLGTALWAAALAGDSRTVQSVRALDAALPVERLGSASLGQALRGLVAAAEELPSTRSIAMELATRYADELLGRFSARAGLFRALPNRPTGLRSTLGLRITSFASQVYPLLGLASLCRYRGEAPPAALRLVAETIVRAQGPLGQWWWLYSPVDGTVLEGYPVYSVHQDGMAFMGLVPVERLGEGSYGEALDLGLRWIFARNELSISLASDEPPFICRNIQRAGSDADAIFGISRGNYARVVARSLHPRSVADRAAARPESLEVLRECRSYHLGWLLYAYALTGAKGTGV